MTVNTEQDLAPDPGQPGPAASVISWGPTEFPWWLVAMVGIIAFMGIAVLTSEEFREAFDAIVPLPWSWTKGLMLTLFLTFVSFVLATFVGLFIALFRLARYAGRRWYWTVLFVGVALFASLALLASVRSTTPEGGSYVESATTELIIFVVLWLITALAVWRQDIAVVIVRNTAILYIEFIRGIPMLVFIFVIAFVLVPEFTGLLDLRARAINEAVRATVALSLFYAAFIAEVFRAGIQSVPQGQIEAGRSVGLSEPQIMRKITLPQAVRNMLPALGNDLISLMKDTSLVSVLAVSELTHLARLYVGSSFRFREAYFILVILYVTLTLGLSLLLRWYERRISIPGY